LQFYHFFPIWNIRWFVDGFRITFLYFYVSDVAYTLSCLWSNSFNLAALEESKTKTNCICKYLVDGINLLHVVSRNIILYFSIGKWYWMRNLPKPWVINYKYSTLSLLRTCLYTNLIYYGIVFRLKPRWFQAKSG
jgi:hypothetical protein